MVLQFYAMVSFCNPGVLGDPATFRKRFERPILEGREPGVAPEKEAIAAERSAELSHIVNAFILRRTNTLLSAHLPPKVCSFERFRNTLHHCIGSSGIFNLHNATCMAVYLLHRLTTR